MIQYALFGADKTGREALQILGEDKVFCFIDNYAADRVFLGKPVMKLQEFMELGKRLRIIITSHKYNRIRKQLLDSGITDFEVFYKLYRCMDVREPQIMGPGNWQNELGKRFDKEGMDILEVGSREVEGSIREIFTRANYTGFDLYEGANVDVTGDAHKLSDYFKKDKKFDLIVSLYVFEHLAMPWVVAEEIMKMLKLGGSVFIIAPFAFAAHERPWDFFRFSEQGLKTLFPKDAGMECLDYGMTHLMLGENMPEDEQEGFLERKAVMPGLYTYSYYWGRKTKELEDFSWRNVNYYDAVGLYPPNTEVYQKKSADIKKCLIWGAGSTSLCNFRFFCAMPFAANYEIEAFVDNDSGKWGSRIEGKPCISPSDINLYHWDIICIWSHAKQKIIEQLARDFGIGSERTEEILQPFYDKLYLKYRDSEDKEIQKILDKIKRENRLDIFYYQPESEWKCYEAFYDEKKDLHYILFEEKKMYISRNYEFQTLDGRKYVHDIWREQDKNSPHRYESENACVRQGDILVDGGACEGNFTLHHIEKVKKAYVVECEPDWMEALRCTFEPWADKIVFCSKFLADKDSETTITVDTLTGNRADFIKLDVEGGETKALSGAKRTLAGNERLRCSVCTYHKSGDEKQVKQLLSGVGFDYEVSEGYMLYLHDPDVLKNPELRRGVVRGYRSHDKQG